MVLFSSGGGWLARGPDLPLVLPAFVLPLFPIAQLLVVMPPAPGAFAKEARRLPRNGFTSAPSAEAPSRRGRTAGSVGISPSLAARESGGGERPSTLPAVYCAVTCY